MSDNEFNVPENNNSQASTVASNSLNSLFATNNEESEVANNESVVSNYKPNNISNVESDVEEEEDEELKEMINEMREYYQDKLRNPALFDRDEDGNLVEKNKKGGVERTVTLHSYRPPTTQELQEMEEKRKAAILKASNEFDEREK